jgi:hypothetical protein
VSEGKPLDVLDEQERFCISMLAVPAVNRRIKALGIRFTAVEKADEARAIFKVRGEGGGHPDSERGCFPSFISC